MLTLAHSRGTVYVVDRSMNKETSRMTTFGGKTSMACCIWGDFDTFDT